MHQIQLELLYLIHSANIYPRPTVYWHADYMDLHQKDIMPPPMEFTILSNRLPPQRSNGTSWKSILLHIQMQQNKTGKKVGVICGSSLTCPFFELTRWEKDRTSYLLKTWNISCCGLVRLLPAVATATKTFFPTLVKEKFIFDRCSLLASGFPSCSDSGTPAPSTLWFCQFLSSCHHPYSASRKGKRPFKNVHLLLKWYQSPLLTFYWGVEVIPWPHPDPRVGCVACSRQSLPSSNSTPW